MILRNVLRNLRRSFSTARESIEYDVAIVGGGPAGHFFVQANIGLATAIRLKQLAKNSKKPDLSVCVLEKGSAIGSHLISGCILEPNALRELLPQADFTNVIKFLLKESGAIQVRPC